MSDVGCMSKMLSLSNPWGSFYQPLTLWWLSLFPLFFVLSLFFLCSLTGPFALRCPIYWTLGIISPQLIYELFLGLKHHLFQPFLSWNSKMFQPFVFSSCFTTFCIYLYVCMFACLHVCMCVCVCMYVCMYVHMYVCIYVCIYINTVSFQVLKIDIPIKVKTLLF